MGARVAFDEVVAAGDAVLAAILIAERLHGRDADASLFEVKDAELKVEDGFGGESGNGGAADVFDGGEVRAEGGFDAGTFVLEFAGPGEVIFGEGEAAGMESEGHERFQFSERVE